MLKLHDFKERVDFELNDCSIKSSFQAIKTDASRGSLKHLLDLNCIKSCDYISFRGYSTLTLIECSDLVRQQDHLSDGLNELINLSLSAQDKTLAQAARKVRKNHKLILDNLIESELSTKCKDTFHLVNKITGFKNINILNRFETRCFVVVTNKLRTTNPVDAIALDHFKRELEHNLKSSLQCLVTAVYVVTPDYFVSMYK